MTEFKELVGQTIVKIVGGKHGDEEIVFTLKDGRRFKQYHSQDCCENVVIEDVCGDLDDLLNAPVLFAAEESNSDPFPRPGLESYTWTFYKISTIKGGVTIRWLGEGNGYYSETVSFVEIDREADSRIEQSQKVVEGTGSVRQQVVAEMFPGTPIINRLRHLYRITFDLANPDSYWDHTCEYLTDAVSEEIARENWELARNKTGQFKIVSVECVREIV